MKAIISEEIKSPIAIFLNSAELILGIIRKLRIEKDSKVFCGDNAYTELKNENLYLSKVFDGLDKYNFFTSRFYSAVDLECEEEPYVIMITECRNKK